MRLTDEQIEVLLRGIVRSRVKEREGMSYVETWDIRAMMNRVFGFCGWSLISTSPTTLVFEREWGIGKDKKPGFKVAYKAELELIVHLPDGDARYAGTAIGEATMPDYKVGDAHDMAAKSAESGALKRAATNLGDQFGLSLYSGTINPVVRKIVGFNTGQASEPEHHDEPEPTPETVVPPAERETHEPSAEEQAPVPSEAAPVDAGAGEGSAPSPAPPSPPIDEALGPDPGPGSRPRGDSPDEGLKRRMEAVEASMKGLTNRQKIAVNALCRGEGIKAWASPSEDELDKVLAVIGRVARGETQ